MFADSDIKEYLRRHGDTPFYVNLLARLDAAERVISFSDSQKEPQRRAGYFEALNAWRKACGR